MRETRRTLQAVNTQLRSQIAVHNHATRASLHDMIRMTRERNEHILLALAKAQKENEALRQTIAEMAEKAKLAEQSKVAA